MYNFVCQFEIPYNQISFLCVRLLFFVSHIKYCKSGYFRDVEMFASSRIIYVLQKIDSPEFKCWQSAEIFRSSNFLTSESNHYILYVLSIKETVKL